MWDWIKPAYDSLQGSRRPTVFVEGDGVVSTRETSGMTVKEHITKIERDGNAGNAGKCAPGNAGPPPQADLCARDNGVIIADKHTNGTFDKMEFTVKKTS